MSVATRPCVVITTYARPDGLGRLLDDLEREAPAGGLDVRVYDDATPNPGPRLEQRLAARGWSYRRAAANHGKRGWWRWWNTILEDLRTDPAQLFYVLQDDARLCDRFFERSLTLWDAIADPAKASLYLHLSAGRAELGSQCWTPVLAQPAGDVVQCGWVDMHALLCGRRLFDAVDWRLRPIAGRRWEREPHLSSGVGQQLSVRAHRHGLRMYRVDRSLTVHDGSPSLMNAAARERWSMETVGFVDGEAAARRHTVPRPQVFASLASIPRRERALEQVVGRLLAQADRVGVYLNGYERAPPFLDDARVDVVRSQDQGDNGDAGKFFWAGTLSGYHLVCDDDIDYPADYVERLVAGIERHGRLAVVGYHGRILAGEIVDYHRSRRLLHFSRALGADTPVHVLGTGVCGYHPSAIRVSATDFAAPNMADVWFALLGQRQRVPFVSLAHEEGWLRELPQLPEDSIYGRARRRSRGRGLGPETAAVLAHAPWELHARQPAAAAGRVRVARAPRPQHPAPAPVPVPARQLVRVRVTGPEREATLVLPERDHITDAIQRTGTYYERDLLDAIRDRGPRGTFVDVGAHFGNHSTFFALECGADHVVAIEPSARAGDGLRQTVAENALDRQVTVRRMAAHPTWRQVAVAALPWSAPPGAPTRTNSGRVAVTLATDHVDAPAAPLDEILAGIGPVGLVKVDAEGMSAEILGSGVGILRRDRPLVAAEAATAHERSAVQALMASVGYREVEPSYGWTPTWLWEPVDGPVDFAASRSSHTRPTTRRT